MKKSYSSLNILQNKLSVGNPKGFFQSFFSSRKYITLKLPYYQYLRGQIFIEDIKDNYTTEIPFNFDIAHFILMLYFDFLQQVKKGVKNEDVATYLKASLNTHFPEKRVFNQVNRNLFQFENVEEQSEGYSSEKYAYLDIRVKEKIILRGEVLLYDLSPYLEENANITVEQLISIIYLDFIKNVQDNGNSVSIQDNIVKRLKKSIL